MKKPKKIQRLNVLFVLVSVIILALYTWYAWGVANSDLPAFFKFWLLK